jgi:predicted TIM-barrel fold metal-dependent hydrolase
VSGTEERYLVISADCHAGLPCEDYRPYLEQKYLRAFDEFLAERRAMREQRLADSAEFVTHWEEENAQGLTGAYDPAQRDRELDGDGVAGEVLFPDADAVTGSASPPFGAGLSAADIQDPELAFAGARAHNRFLAELCAHSPERRAGVALVPITHDVERGVAEIEWSAANGLRGILVPTLWRGHEPYHHPRYEPVWEACARLHMPVHTHSGSAPQDEYLDNVGIYLAEVVWWAARPLWFLLFGGAFERHPDLKFVVTESAAYWAPDLMWKWDTYLGGGHTTKKMVGQLAGKVSRLPSEYFGRNVFIGASTMSREEIRRRYAIGTDTVMWGNDYPHPEGTWPHTVAKLKETFHDVPVEDTRAMLGGVAARVYGFDVDALAPLAARIGPTPGDLGQDPARTVDPAEVARGRWWKDGLVPPGSVT